MELNTEAMKADVITALAALGVTRATVEYDASPTTYEVSAAKADAREHVLPEPLEHAIIDLCNRYLTKVDGGRRDCGHLIFDVAAGTVTLERSTIVETFEVDTFTF